MRFAAIAVLTLVLALPAPAAPAPKYASLKLVSTAPLVVTGTRFGSREPVLLTYSNDDLSRRVIGVRAKRDGSFRARFELRLDRCAAFTVRAAVGLAGVDPIRIGDPAQNLRPVEPVREVEALALAVLAEGRHGRDQVRAVEEDRPTRVAVARAALALRRVGRGLQVELRDRSLVVDRVRVGHQALPERHRPRILIRQAVAADREPRLLFLAARTGGRDVAVDRPRRRQDPEAVRGRHRLVEHDDAGVLRLRKTGE